MGRGGRSCSCGHSDLSEAEAWLQAVDDKLTLLRTVRKNGSGFVHVFKMKVGQYPFLARIRWKAQRKSLGYHRSAAGAALTVARHLALPRTPDDGGDGSDTEAPSDDELEVMAEFVGPH